MKPARNTEVLSAACDIVEMCRDTTADLQYELTQGEAAYAIVNIIQSAVDCAVLAARAALGTKTEGEK